MANEPRGAQGLYARIFHWLVKKCNVTLDQVGIPRDHFIGVLDIAGFEIFDVRAKAARETLMGTSFSITISA